MDEEYEFVIEDDAVDPADEETEVTTLIIADTVEITSL